MTTGHKMQMGAAGTAAAGGSAYTTDAVYFDGTNDGLNLNSALTGSTDTKNLLFSAWVTHDVDNSSDVIFEASAQEKFIVYIDSSGDLEIRLKNSSSTALISGSQYSAPGVITAAGGWHHILIAADMANTTFQVYINDTEETGAYNYTFTDDFIGLGSGAASWHIGVYSNGGIPWAGDMADLYMTNEYLDISVLANRRKFIDANGKPVDLGANGSTPTGTQPLIYLQADASTPDNFADNLGSGDDFTVTGALTNASSSPTDSYTTDAVLFDGTNDRLLLTGGFTDSNKFIISFWLNRIVDGQSYNVCFDLQTSGQAEKVVGYFESADVFKFYARNSSNSKGWGFTASTAHADTDGWRHYLISYDGDGPTGHFYQDDADDASSETLADKVVQWNINCYIGGHQAAVGTYSAELEFADFYINSTEYLDFSVESNRRKFIDDSGKPVDLGSDGSIPTGTAPDCFLKANAGTPDNFAVNLGTEGDFAVTGALTNASSSPTD